MTAKTKAIVTALVVALTLAAIKTAMGIVTMSISLLASALDSVMDILSMSVMLLAVRTSEKPADEAHPFGHGKAEPIAGLVQAVLIGVSASFLIYQAGRKIMLGYHLEDEMAGIAVMVIATLASIYLTRRLKRASLAEESSALAAGALNFGADVWTNIGVLVALGLERFGAVKNADPIISILISLYIGLSAVRVARDAITQLMDRTLPEAVLAQIDKCIMSHGHCIRGYHRLCTRRVGAEKFIEFHLEIDKDASFEHAHGITESIIADIHKAIPGSRVTVHSDPS